MGDKLNNLLCRILGHRIASDTICGKRIKGLSIVERKIIYCSRCGKLISRIDKEIGKWDLKEGIPLWGSLGICPTCKNFNSCDYAISSNVGHVILKCPIQNYIPKERFRKDIEDAISRDMTILQR